jgi:hypothetical protein
MTTDLALPAITMCAGSYTTNRDTINNSADRGSFDGFRVARTV